MTKALRQPKVCTAQASGVEVISMPTPPTLMVMPESAAKRPGG